MHPHVPKALPRLQVRLGGGRVVNALDPSATHLAVLSSDPSAAAMPQQPCKLAAAAAWATSAAPSESGSLPPAYCDSSGGGGGGAATAGAAAGVRGVAGTAAAQRSMSAPAEAESGAEQDAAISAAAAALRRRLEAGTMHIVPSSCVVFSASLGAFLSCAWKLLMMMWMMALGSQHVLHHVHHSIWHSLYQCNPASSALNCGLPSRRWVERQAGGGVADPAAQGTAKSPAQAVQPLAAEEHACGKGCRCKPSSVTTRGKNPIT